MPTVELDWFAVDETGAMGLFATAGEGFITDAVIEYRVMHETVANSIEYPNWGTEAIWDDAAVLGLYVYDWSASDAAYLRAATPTHDVDEQIQLMVSRITDLPMYKGAFSATEKIGALDTFEHVPSWSGK